MNPLLSRLSGVLVITLLAVALVPRINLAAAREADTQDEISAELIGQVYNPSPQVSAQYGYISYLKCFATDAITGGSKSLSEQSALLTFYSHTRTEQVINNGPLRVIDRTGEVTFYFTTTPHGDFAVPDTLRD